jgi:membrane peptidoglycan carboxypeptidase
LALTNAEQDARVTDRVDDVPLPDIVPGGGPTTVTGDDGQVLGVLAATTPPGPASDPVNDRVVVELLDDQVIADRLSERGVTGGRDARAALLADAGLVVETAIRPGAVDAARASVGASEPGATTVVVSLEPSTGEIVALSGPVGTVEAQAGSAYLPIVMAGAIESGVGVDEQIPAPARYVVESIETVAPEQPWTVGNFGDVDLETVTLGEALAVSANTPWVALFDQGRLDPDRVAALAERLGIPRDDATRPALPASLLGVDYLRPVDVASVYASFAMAGDAVDAHTVTRILDAEGNVVYDADTRPQQTEPALDASVAETVREAMEQAVCCGASTPAALDEGIAHFGQSGTTYNGASAWYAGSTPALTTVVWTGYVGQVTSYRPLTGNDAAPVWRAYMEGAAAGPSDEQFPG